MALGFGGQGNKEQRMNREMFEAEMKFERNQQALGQAGADIPEYRDPELIKWQQMDEEVEKICMGFRGMEKTDGKWQHIKVFLYKDTDPVTGRGRKHYGKLKPIMNEKGISWFKGRLDPFVSKNVIMSNYDEPRILEKLKHAMIDFIIDLGVQQDEFDIDKKDFRRIKSAFHDLFEPALFRSLGNGERKWLSTTSRRLESVTSDGKEQTRKKGLLDGLMG